MSELFKFLQDNSNIANSLIAIFAFFISALSLLVSIGSLMIQSRHNKLSVTPIPEISMSDYEDLLRVKLKNNGQGPMRITGIKIENGLESSSKLIDLMPKLPDGKMWKTFSGNIIGRTVMAGYSAPTLMEIEFQNGCEFQYFRDTVRESLQNIIITLNYTDIYNTRFPPFVKSLEWFGRSK